jgi:signal transduction histidine kinase/DNA-binding response OmpR family regulator
MIVLIFFIGLFSQINTATEPGGRPSCVIDSLETELRKATDSITIADLCVGIYDRHRSELTFFPKEYDYLVRALRIYEKAGLLDKSAYVYNELAGNHYNRNQIDKARNYWYHALELYTKSGNRIKQAIAYSNLSTVSDATESREYLEKAIQLQRTYGDTAGLAGSVHNLGSWYYAMGNMEEAEKYLMESVRLAESIGAASTQQAGYLWLGKVRQQQGKFREAIQYIKKSIRFNSMRENDDPNVINAYQALAELCTSLHDYEQAYHYQSKLLKIKDTLFQEQNIRNILELEARYETEKKEQEITILNKEKALQESKFNNSILLLGLSVAIALAVITSLFITIRSNRRRQESERLLLNEQLRNKDLEAGKLHELDELKSRFFSNIAHEFRTPLTLISGPVENLLEENKDKYSKDQLMLVKNNSSRLLALINQLLDLSKLESGVTKLELQKGNIVAFLKGFTFSFQSLADDKEIALLCDVPDEACTMDFDRDKLEKVMGNLLSNAFKFTPDLGSVKVSAATMNKDGNDHLEIKVTDSGVGIPEEQLPFVFNRFYQADNVRTSNAPGSGIGLALTKELVELHGGMISVTSSSGSGTVFTVSLPVCDDANVTASPHEAPKENVRASERRPKNGEAQDLIVQDDQTKEIVLVIEDNREVRNFIIDSLKNSYHLISAVDGDEGIAKAREAVPDLIISDVMMPGKNGYDTCRILKDDERTSHIPVVLLTAKAGLESKIEGLETGADDFVAKPFSTRELQVRIKNLITTRKKLREKYLDAALSDESPGDTLEDAFLIKIKEAVEAHLDDPEFSVEDLCRKIGMSRTQLHRKLKALTNQSVTQFVRILKLQHGKKLLQQGRYNVSEVADRVGFASLTYFSSSYASHFGYAPSEEKARH